MLVRPIPIDATRVSLALLSEGAVGAPVGVSTGVPVSPGFDDVQPPVSVSVPQCVSVQTCSTGRAARGESGDGQSPEKRAPIHGSPLVGGFITDGGV